MTRVDADGAESPVPVAWLDSFAMRNFTNEAVFDDTLPVGDGLMEAGSRVPLPALAAAMDVWFRRKGWLGAGQSVRVVEEEGQRPEAGPSSLCSSG